MEQLELRLENYGDEEQFPEPSRHVSQGDMARFSYQFAENLAAHGVIDPIDSEPSETCPIHNSPAPRQEQPSHTRQRKQRHRDRTPEEYATFLAEATPYLSKDATQYHGEIKEVILRYFHTRNVPSDPNKAWGMLNALCESARNYVEGR